MRKSLTLALALALSGLAGNADAQVTVVSSNVVANTTWSGTVILDGPIFVKDGATLTILAGTVVRGQPRSGPVVPMVTAGTPGALIVTQDGRIVANGDASSPIIFTTAAVDNDLDGEPDDSTPGDPFLDQWTPGLDGIPGTADDDRFLDDTPTTSPLAPVRPSGEANEALWGGLVLLGTAPTNLGGGAGVGVGRGIVEGLTVPGFPVADATYGGVEPHDSSGIVRYVSVRHAGDEIGESNELNGITLGGVGDGTVFEFVEVYMNFDDGIEWFGGTVNGNNLHVLMVGDDHFDVDQGYTGTNQFLFSVGAYFPTGSSDGDKVGEWDGDDSDINLCGPQTVSSLIPIPALADPAPCPLQQSYFWNLTAIQNAATASATNSDNEGIEMRNGFGGQLANSIVVDTGTEEGLDTVASGAATGWSVADNICSDTQKLTPTGDFGDLVRVATSTFGNGWVGSSVPDGGPGCQGDETDAFANGLDYADSLSALPNAFLANTVTPGTVLVSQDIEIDIVGDAGFGLSPAAEIGAALNPRPGAGAGFGINPEGSGLDSSASQRGAFSATAPALWTEGWTVLSISGLLN